MARPLGVALQVASETSRSYRVHRHLCSRRCTILRPERTSHHAQYGSKHGWQRWTAGHRKNICRGIRGCLTRLPDRPLLLASIGDFEIRPGRNRCVPEIDPPAEDAVNRAQQKRNSGDARAKPKGLRASTLRRILMQNSGTGLLEHARQAGPPRACSRDVNSQGRDGSTVDRIHAGRHG